MLLALHLVGLVGYSLLLRRQAHQNTLHPWVLATVLQTATFAVPLLLALFITPDFTRFTPLSLLVACVAAGLGVLLYVAGVKALKHLEASTYAVVYSMRIIVATALAALLLSEQPTLLQFAGGLCILAAVVVLRQKGAQKVITRGIMWAIIAAVAASTLALSEKWLITEVGLFNAAPVATFIGAAAMWIAVWARRLPAPTTSIFTRQMVSLLVLRTVASWAWIFALAAGALVSIATYISSLSVVIVTALGILLLGERDYLRRKVTAVLLAVIGLSCILL